MIGKTGAKWLFFGILSEDNPRKLNEKKRLDAEFILGRKN